MSNWDSHRQVFDPTPQRKLSASSSRRWGFCVGLQMVALFTTFFILIWGRLELGTSQITKYGLGIVHSATILNIFSSGANTLLLNVIIVNLPQLLLSITYFNYNALYTCISLATEWDRFCGGTKKGLRVSTKQQGDQRETYFLQLPYRYSLPLAALSSGIHWLMSQSIFLVRIEKYAGDNFTETTSCGWSPVGTACVVIAGSNLVGFLVAAASRRLRYGGIPVAGSCSAAIAAACHPDPSEGDSLATLPLSWGVVSTTDYMGHCSFSSKDVERPMEGGFYA
ncbi:hypothetical protein GCG54_00010461 [Colletotrichum gloeosporioides]|uniref:Uncharacterized protein n=1 Tax=Colletotrichum gloeosporioides TaxID=474922 RepID=A0A8H4CJM2_COLGL|nr:uncharacterized protein GCG54_00010461 [Colletotrichum gloeosporioides]KAF3805185.1 hypothetical protein GCG54_00010461 [Colletotrichum gloeosporioides]